MKTIVIGDSPYGRTTIVWRLERLATVVGSGASIDEAGRYMQGLRPDLAVLATDDVAVARGWRDELRARWPGLGIVVAGDLDPGSHLSDLLDTPPIALVPCTATHSALGRALRAIAAGESLLTVAATAEPDASGATDPLEELTDTELRVLDALSRGHSNDEIALSLSMSRHTVKTHVRHVTEKLGAVNRTDAARMFLRSQAS